jgi:hypothetical protein
VALSPFDTMKLCFSKERYLSSDELKGYTQWLMNKQISCDQQLVFLAAELNVPLDNKLHYDCLYYGLPKGKKYIPWLCSKPKKETEIQYLMEHFKVDQTTAKMYREIISEDEMTKIIDFNEKRGIKK